MADGPDGPLPDPAGIASVRELTDPEILLGWVVRRPGWLDSFDGPVATIMAGIGLRDAVASGRVQAVGTRLSAMPGLLAGRLRPTIAVVGAVADGSGFRFAGSVGWAPAAARHADAVVIERWPDGGHTDAPRVEGRVVEVMDRTDPPDLPQSASVGLIEHTIAGLIVGLIPRGAIVQWGPGALGAAVVDALDQPVRVHSGLVTDELVTLDQRGLLSATAEAAYLWGGPALTSMMGAGKLRLRPVSETHDLNRLGALPRFVAINSALQVGLDGSVNVERVGHRVVSGPGGHPDFCLGASRSIGGLSVVALRAAHGDRSAIVDQPTVVSTARSDVDVVVTEHGVADLRGLTDRDRAQRLISVAAPEHRRALRQAL